MGFALKQAWTIPMSFGQHLRALRRSRNLGQKALAALVGLNYTYLSKIENERLDFAQYPSEDTICKLAQALDVDEDELLLLAEKVPPRIRQRILQRPDAFLAFSKLSDSEIDDLLVQVNKKDPEAERLPAQPGASRRRGNKDLIRG